MFDFKETSENFGRALETTVQGLVDEYRPQLKQDVDDAIKSAERSFEAAAAAGIDRLSGELNRQIDHLKRQTDDSILLARSEMAALVSDSLSQFRRRIVGPAVWLVCFLLMALAGTVGFLLGAAWRPF